MYNQQEHYIPRFFLKLFLVLFSIGGVTAIVYFTGGTKNPYPHLMYIPLVIGGFLLGHWIGALLGILAGILLGPVMPMDVAANLAQGTYGWLLRLIVFVLIGLFSGIAKRTYKTQNSRIKKSFLYHDVSNIPNMNMMDTINFDKYENMQVLLITILIHSHQNLVQVFGQNVYFKLLNKIYIDLSTEVQQDGLIVSNNSNRFWIMTTECDIEKADRYIAGALSRSGDIDDVPLYFEYSLGYELVDDILKLKPQEIFYNSDLCARLAYYNNKRSVVFDGTQRQQESNYSLLSEFTEALETNQTYLVYQPKVALAAGGDFRVEALIRWEHPKRGFLSPAEFLPLIENTKLINNLSIWVLKRSIEKIKEFEALGIKILVSINISPKNILNEDFVREALEIVSLSNINPAQLEFEITESSFMNRTEENIEVMKIFKNAGISIALDDYGKSFSSLSFISLLPIDFIKIDKLFIDKILADESQFTIVKSTIGLAHELGFKVIAEGIEEKKQMDVLKTLKCDYIQGYYIAKPLDDLQLDKWYKKYFARKRRVK